VLVVAGLCGSAGLGVWVSHPIMNGRKGSRLQTRGRPTHGAADWRAQLEQ
jgi:hypothetical protein